MSAEPTHHPQTLVNNDDCDPGQQTSNFQFLTNVVEDSEVRDRTLSVVTYHGGEERPENYEFSVNYSASHSARVRSALQVSPSPHYLCPTPQQARSYTSVNLTLRPPSSEPQPPIDIRSAGSSLTYSTCSYDSRQGFQSQLQIRIGPGGVGSVSAVRTQAPSVRTSYSSACEGQGEKRLQSCAHALLQEQVERKNKLERELRKEKDNLRTMQREVHEMRKDLEQRQRRKQNMSLPIVSTVLQKVHELRVEIQRLQEECKKMTQEVDLNLDSRVPLGETDEEFYKNIYTGQQGFILPPSSRPPAPRPARRLQHGDSADGPHWICTQCTFQNHPLLDKCETCEMPRLLLAGGELQDIHIHVTHHNFPARRVIHSWVV